MELIFLKLGGPLMNGQNKQAKGGKAACRMMAQAAEPEKRCLGRFSSPTARDGQNHAWQL